MYVQIESDGHWSWRSAFEVAHSRPPTQSGRWFVFDDVLVLRIERSAGAEIPPGIAFTYDLRRVLHDKIVLLDRSDERETTWARSANQSSQATAAPRLDSEQSR